ncbi:MAG: hypothetical protein ACRDZ3_21200 [Acidimicrobiia bacterium]
MDRDVARQLAAAVAWARVGLGLTAMVTPAVPLRPWVGREVAWRPRAKLLGRALGARDVALGVGVILALRHEAPVRGWVEGGGMADAGDLFATLLAFPTLPKFGRWAVLASSAGAVAASRLAAPSVDSG